MFWITFATTKERVTPPAGQKTNVREELGELLATGPGSCCSLRRFSPRRSSALRSGSTLFYFKYVAGDDGSPLFLGLDRSTLFLTTGALGLVLGTVCLGPIARKIDKKYYAAALSLMTGLCFFPSSSCPRMPSACNSRSTCLPSFAPDRLPH